MPPGPDGVRAARRHVQSWVLERLGAEVADDAALLSAELLANAHQHGAPPVVVHLKSEGQRAVIEVSDASPRWPLLALASTANMTGRGFALVDAIASNWGVRAQPAGGKTVWCELSAGSTAESAGVDLDALLAREAEHDSDERRFTVVLGDVPTPMLIAAKAHVDNLVREFSLAAAGDRGGTTTVPEHFATLVETVVHRFAEAREAIKRQALAAAKRGDARTSLTLRLPLSSADAGEAYLAALDEVDGYARAARLLTLETPSDHRLFRHWYVEAVVDQLRRIGRGEPPGTIEPFEERLLAEVRSMAAAQRVSDQAARLQRVTAALARTTTPEDVAAVVISEAVSALGASGGGLLVPGPDGEHLAVPGAVGYGEKLMGQLREERLDAPLPAATALRTATSIWLESQEERDSQFPEMRGFEPSTIAMCAIPLVVGDRSIGALRFSFDSVKLFDDVERAFVIALAAQTAQTLQRTEQYAAERQAALELQRALLPQALARIRGWDIAAYYSPAGGQEIGGDFYDVVPVPDGRIAAIVGDVMGRGVQAAAAMAEVRSVIRAYVVDDADPAAVFKRVDAFFEAFDLEQLVTVLYMLVDSDSNEVQIGNAGHLPPLLITADAAAVLPVTGGLPFGAGGDERVITTITLEAGAAVVAITDGLVERRGEDLDVGVRRLLDATGGRVWETPDALTKCLVSAASAQREHDDDVTVLALRRE